MPLISSGLTIMVLLDNANRGYPEDRISALEKSVRSQRVLWEPVLGSVTAWGSLAPGVVSGIGTCPCKIYCPCWTML